MHIVKVGPVVVVVVYICFLLSGPFVRETTFLGIVSAGPGPPVNCHVPSS